MVNLRGLICVKLLLYFFINAGFAINQRGWLRREVNRISLFHPEWRCKVLIRARATNDRSVVIPLRWNTSQRTLVHERCRLFYWSFVLLLDTVGEGSFYLAYIFVRLALNGCCWVFLISFLLHKINLAPVKLHNLSNLAF